jgi:hypothetical protein
MMSIPTVIASEAKQSSYAPAGAQENAEVAAIAALFCLARFARSWIASSLRSSQ